MSTRKSVAEAFNQRDVVRYYEFLTQLYGFSSAEQQVIDRCMISPENVLVAGCGTGREIVGLHRQHCHVVGVDYAWEMLCKARQKRLEQQTHTVSFQQGDIVHLPYRDSSFDHVLMLAQVIQHIPKRQFRRQTLREAYRVLKPGGVCILSVFNEPISFLYILLLAQHHQHRFYQQHQGHQGNNDDTQKPRKTLRLLRWLQEKYKLSDTSQNQFSLVFAKIVQRIIWEIDPTIWSYSDPLPTGYRILFSILCTVMNRWRTLRIRLSRNPENLLEPNDFLLPCPDVHFHIFPNKGDLFVHFPDVDEMLEDIDAAGFKLVEYKSLEELQLGQEFSEEERRKKRLLFYVAQKV